MKAPDWRAGYLDSRIGQLHFRTCGTGRPLLLLHQPPRSSLVYRRLVLALQALDVRTIALDLPGFGQSCDLPEGTTMDGLAELVAEAVGALESGPVGVFGLHTGNKIGAALAAAHPALVDRLILAGMTHSIILDATARNAAMRAYVEAKKPTDPLQDPPAWHDEQIDRLHARGVERLYAANYGFDLQAILPCIATPTLVMELAVPEEEALGRQAGAWCALLPQGEALRIDGNDSELLQSRPAEMARAITGFLEKPMAARGAKETHP